MTTTTVVAATKLTIPTSRRALVPRPDLVTRLDGDFRMGLVSAPAGYGKTATLASWAAGVGQPLAWLSCDASDVEPKRFMGCLLSAIAASWPGVADDAFVLLEREGSTTYDAAVAVANELAAVAEGGVIVVDDLHLAAPDPAMLTAFLTALPDRFRFVAGTRSDPPMSLARLHVRGELLALRSDDLRFRDAEMSAFFALHNVSVVEDDLRRLHDLTEGWPAGVQLAAIALQRGTSHEDFIRALADTDRSVGDFLVTEVLANLPLDLVEFLVATSVLDAFDADLCADITGRDDAAAVLEQLVTANLFVVPLDDRARWYRYHHLFGSFLRARLASHGPAKLRAAHDRAGHALEARGDVAGALQHALAVHDHERAGQVLRSAIDRSMNLADGAGVAATAIRLWLHQYGMESVRTDPIGLLELMIGLISLGAHEDARPWIARVRDAHPDASGEFLALLEGSWGEYHQHRGEPLEAIRRDRLAMAAVDGRPPARGLLAAAHTALARAHLQAGDLQGAAGVIDEALRNPVGSRVPDEVRNPALGAFIAARNGQLSLAGVLAEAARRAADAMGLGVHEPGRIFAGLAHAEVHVERGDDEGATCVLDAVRRAADASLRVALQSPVGLSQARAARASGDESSAAALLDQARMLHPAPDAALRHVFDAEAARQALRFNPARAGAVIDVLDPSRPESHVLRCRLALAEGDGRRAAALLTEIPPPVSLNDRVERAVLSALAVLDRDVEQANAHLHAALTTAMPERLVRTVVDAGPDVHRLLKSYTPDSQLQSYVEDLLVAAGGAVAPVRAKSVTSLVEPLSDREITVLRYLCSRLTNAEIAGALYVSPNTLKSHVRSVYRKLGVGSRAEAVDAGRQHGLI